MNRRLTAGLTLIMLILSMLAFTFNLQPVKASGTIYIRADGSVDPSSAPISRNGNFYILTDNISDSIVIERDNIVVEGAGNIVEGTGNGNGIDLSSRTNVTIRNMKIRAFDFGVYLSGSSANMIQGNNITDNDVGIFLLVSSNNTLIGNTLINDYNCSIYLYANCTGNAIGENSIKDTVSGINLADFCNYNTIFRNTIRTPAVFGIYIRTSSNNNLVRNDIRDNYVGVGFESCQDNSVYNNNFVNNTMHVSLLESVDFWDAGYPTCGNYWDDYSDADVYSGAYQNETGSDGIGDTPYVIDIDNVDNYPLMDPWILDLGAQNHMIVAYQYSPRTLDPAVSYDTANTELIMNVYETLIFFDEEKTNQFVPHLATEWDISPDGLNYTFTIRQGVKFHNGETLTTEDVEYSFERFLVLDIPEGPSWMVYEPLFDTFGSRDDEGELIITGQQIDDAITRTETAVTIHLTKPYPPFMQILAQGWASILCKKWCREIGDWPGTWNNWTLYNRPYKTAIENQTTEPPGPHINAMCGTGPFILDYYQTDVEWSIIKFDNYWGGWPAPDSNGFLQRVTGKTIMNWEVRKNMFLEGQLDYITVPRTSIDEVLEQPGIRCIYPLEDLTCMAMFFTFNISTSSPYMGVPSGLPIGTFNESGIPPNFFSDVNIRKGFAYAFNYSKLIEEELRGEAYQPATPIIPGLPFYNPAQEKYSTNLDMAMDCFAAAWGGQVWDNGFNFTICYNEANSMRRKACEIIQSNVQSLNSKFHIQIQSVPYGNNYSISMANHELPIFVIGWLADFADPHNFVYGFMYSDGPFATWQVYSNGLIDNLMLAGIGTTNDTVRRQMYSELQQVYHLDCPSVPLYQSIGRRFERDWVRGWYYNQILWSMNYFYVQWKGTIHLSTTYSWPMLHHDLTHAGYSDSPAPNTNQTLWKYTTSSFVFTSPAVVDGKVYFGSYDRNVYCLDALTGTRTWNYTTGEDVDSSPTVVDGRVYIGSIDRNVYCLDASSGALVWNHTFGWSFSSSPAVAYGRVYIGSFCCLNASNGTLLWSNPIGSAGSSPAVVDGKVYAGSNFYGICCLDAFSGALIWNYTRGNDMRDPAVVDGRVYIGSIDNKTYCLNALTGEQIWNYTTGGYVLSLPAVAYGKVYVGSYDNKLYCLDALTGERIWSYTTGGYVGSPSVADNKVYVVSQDGKTYCFDASTGAAIWSYYTFGGLGMPPAVADGIVFVGSANGVYAFGNVVKSEDYPTIQDAIDAAPSGATVIIAPGIYNESIVVNKTLTIIGLPGSAPTFNGGGSGIAITLLPGASGSTIAGIVITHFDLGILLVDCTNVKIYDNRISLMDYDGITLEGSNAANNIIHSNIFEQSTVAINLTTSAVSNTVYKNIIVSNNIGLSLESTQNTITANTIAENKVGIDLSDSSNNVIYHNNFINNDIQVSVSESASNTWDDGYPSGGNFWSICSHIDLYKGLDQSQLGSDSINDTEYMIDILNIDRYPLVQPFSPHDIGVTNIVLPKTILGQGSTMDIELEIINYGMFDETFIVTIDANTATIATQTVTLTKRNSTAISVTWNTAGFTKGEYTITAYAWPIQSETDTTDNTRTGGKVIIAMPGDITGFNGLPDGKVDMRDISKVAKLFGVSYPNPKYDANCDIMYDLKIDMKDISFVAKRFGQTS